MLRGIAALLAACPVLSAAPVPRDDARPPVLVGRWDYAYGGCLSGEIVFDADGTYTSHHGLYAAYVGRWRLDGDTVELLESQLDPWGVPGDRYQRYTFTVAPVAKGYAGRTPDGARVVLTR